MIQGLQDERVVLQFERLDEDTIEVIEFEGACPGCGVLS